MNDAVTHFLDKRLEGRKWHKDVADYIRWFADKPQDYWVFAARHWIWDNGTAPFWFMINQPKCSIAVAAHIFWNGTPEFYAAHWDDEEYRNSDESQLLVSICEVATNRGFVGTDLTAMINYDLNDHLSEVENSARPQCPFKKVPPSLANGFGTRFPAIDPSDHPETSAYAYDIFLNNGSRFGRRPEIHLDKPDGWPGGREQR